MKSPALRKSLIFSLGFAFFANAGMAASPISGEIHEMYQINWWTLGSGGGGDTFLEGMPAVMFNPSRISYECDSFLTSSAENRKISGKKPAKNQFNVRESCPIRYELGLPGLSWSHLASDLAGINGTAKQIDFIMDSIGTPITAEAAWYLGMKGDYFGLAAFQTEIVSALVYTDTKNSLADDAVNIEWIDAKGIELGFKIPLEKRYSLGVKAVLLNRKVHLFNSLLTDISKLQSARDHIEVIEGFGLGVDVSYSIGDLKTTGKALSIIGRQLGNLSIDSDFPGSPDKHRGDVIHQTIDISYGYRTYLDERFYGDLGFDFRDIFAQVETNTIKRSHFFFTLGSKTWRMLTGLNQGNITYGLSWNSGSKNIELGQYTEELGNKVGYRPDTRFYLLVAFKF